MIVFQASTYQGDFQFTSVSVCMQYRPVFVNPDKLSRPRECPATQHAPLVAFQITSQKKHILGPCVTSKPPCSPLFSILTLPGMGVPQSSNQRAWPLEKRAVKILAAILPHARTKLFAPDEAGRARMFILKRTPTTESTLSAARPWVGSERGPFVCAE